MMQETERLPCSKKCKIPRAYSPSPQPPAGVKTSPALETRDTVFLFLFFFFRPSAVPGSEAGSCSSSSGLGYVCYPDPDLMFRLTVTSSAPSVCDRLGGHTAGSRAGEGRGVTGVET